MKKLIAAALLAATINAPAAETPESSHKKHLMDTMEMCMRGANALAPITVIALAGTQAEKHKLGKQLQTIEKRKAVIESNTPGFEYKDTVKHKISLAIRIQSDELIGCILEFEGLLPDQK